MVRNKMAGVHATRNLSEIVGVADYQKEFLIPLGFTKKNWKCVAGRKHLWSS